MSALPCPNCGSELAFLEQYRRHYCHMCGSYAPEGYGDRGARTCPNCGGILSFVTQYDRDYCYRCNTYPPVDLSEPKVESSVPAGEGTSTVVVVEKTPLAEEKVQTVEMAPRAEVGEEPEEEVLEEEPETPIEKPHLVRAEIHDAKKPLLLDLCKAYDLDPTGTKEQLRERLLSYLDEVEAVAARKTEPEHAPAGRSEPEAEATDPAPGPAPVVAFEAQEEAVEEEPVQEELAPVAAPVAESRTLQEPEVFGAREEPGEPPHGPIRVEPVTAVEPPVAREALRVEHPCPTCGRELTFVAQYDRWYCYHCRVYAPAAKSKNACPHCGETLRWIQQYERWWCDSCRRYAPADLPKPQASTAATVPEKIPAVQSLPQATPTGHRHRNPGSGIGLVGLGLVLFVVYEALVDVPAILSINTGIAVTNDLAFALRFFAFAFVAAGAMIGLAAVRDRH